MTIGKFSERAADKTTTAAGSAAGAVADPKTGLSNLTKALSKPGVVLGLAALVAAFLLGRRSRGDG